MERSDTRQRPLESRPLSRDTSTKWGRMRTSVLGFWSELTEEDLDGFDGQADQLSDALRKRYGWSEERIDEEIEWWEQESGHDLH